MSESEKVADLIHADLLGLLQSARRMQSEKNSKDWKHLADSIKQSMDLCSPLLDKSTRKLAK